MDAFCEFGPLTPLILNDTRDDRYYGFTNDDDDEDLTTRLWSMVARIENDALGDGGGAAAAAAAPALAHVRPPRRSSPFFLRGGGGGGLEDDPVAVHMLQCLVSQTEADIIRREEEEEGGRVCTRTSSSPVGRIVTGAQQQQPPLFHWSPQCSKQLPPPAPKKEDSVETTAAATAPVTAKLTAAQRLALLLRARPQMDPRRAFRERSVTGGCLMHADDFKDALVSIGDGLLQEDDLDELARGHMSDQAGDDVDCVRFLFSLIDFDTLRDDWRHSAERRLLSLDAWRSGGRKGLSSSQQQQRLRLLSLEECLRRQRGSLTSDGALTRAQVQRALHDLGVCLARWETETLVDAIGGGSGRVLVHDLTRLLDSGTDDDDVAPAVDPDLPEPSSPPAAVNRWGWSCGGLRDDDDDDGGGGGGGGGGGEQDGQEQEGARGKNDDGNANENEAKNGNDDDDRGLKAENKMKHLKQKQRLPRQQQQQAKPAAKVVGDEIMARRRAESTRQKKIDRASRQQRSRALRAERRRESEELRAQQEFARGLVGVAAADPRKKRGNCR